MSSTTTTRRPRGCGKSRAVESEENQKQVFLPSHRPWKSRTTRAIPTFPTAPTAAGIYQTTSGNLIVVDRKECLTPDSFPFPPSDNHSNSFQFAQWYPYRDQACAVCAAVNGAKTARRRWIEMAVGI